MNIHAINFFKGLVRIFIWVLLYGGIFIAVKLAGTWFDDSPFYDPGPYERVADCAILLASLAFFVSCLGSFFVLYLHAFSIMAMETRYRRLRLHMLFWTRLMLLLALGTHLVAEVCHLKELGQFNVWPDSFNALVLAVCFALLLVLDVFADWIYSTSPQTSEAE